MGGDFRTHQCSILMVASYESINIYGAMFPAFLLHAIVKYIPELILTCNRRKGET